MKAAENCRAKLRLMKESGKRGINYGSAMKIRQKREAWDWEVRMTLRKNVYWLNPSHRLHLLRGCFRSIRSPHAPISVSTCAIIDCVHLF